MLCKLFGAAAESLGEQARKLSSVVGMFWLASEMLAGPAANQAFSLAADCRY